MLERLTFEICKEKLKSRYIHGKGDFPGLQFPTFTFGEPYTEQPWEQKRYRDFLDLIARVSSEFADWLDED